MINTYYLNFSEFVVKFQIQAFGYSELLSTVIPFGTMQKFGKKMVIMDRCDYQQGLSVFFLDLLFQLQ